uniref:Metallo-beta-lactamase domain-containing protein n=1 Tax=Chrysotila carterae TaxID=13221 RepID=A0A7S4FCF2_CHRCT
MTAEVTSEQQQLHDFLKNPSVEQALERYSKAYDHDPIEVVIPDKLWVIQGRFHMMIMGSLSKAGFTYVTRTMVIAKDGDQIVLINPFHLSEDGYKQIEALGSVKCLLRTSPNHGGDAPAVVKRFPQAEYWIVDGITLPDGWTTLGVTTKTMSPANLPIEGAELLLVPGLFYTEGVLILPYGEGVLVTVDILQNHNKGACATKHNSYLMGVFMKAGGFQGKGRAGPAMVKSYSQFGKDPMDFLPAFFRILLEKRWSIFISGHGPALVDNAKESVRATLTEQFKVDI